MRTIMERTKEGDQKINIATTLIRLSSLGKTYREAGQRVAWAELAHLSMVGLHSKPQQLLVSDRLHLTQSSIRKRKSMSILIL